MKNQKKNILKVIFSVILVSLYLLPASSFAVEGWIVRTSAGSRAWTSIASSSDGTKLAAVVNAGGIFTSTDSGATWTDRTSTSGSRAWSAITSDSTGAKLAAVVIGGSIWTSTESGETWTARTGPGSLNWTTIASSSDGSKLVAAVLGFTSSLWTSTDSGGTWTDRTALVPGGQGPWAALTSSSDGLKLAAARALPPSSIAGTIYTSTDGGVTTWTARTAAAGSRFWTSIASSTDGTKLAATVNNGFIYTSTDSGVSTWTARDSSRAWTSIASSSDGSKLAATVSTGNIYTSIDSGATWSPETDAGSRAWKSITSSSDGLKLAAVVGSGNIYTFGTLSPATVTTSAASMPHQTDITLEGNITDAGASMGITQRGFNYGLTTSYGTNIDEAGSFSTGTFTGLASGLVCNTLYHFRAYAISSAGTANGGDATFTTAPCDAVSVVVTNAATDIEQSSATLTGEITDVGVSLGITERGFEYGPTTGYGTTVSETGTFTAGTFSASIASLDCSTMYHFRAHATSSAGIGYGGDASFTTSSCPRSSSGGSRVISRSSTVDIPHFPNALNSGCMSGDIFSPTTGRVCALTSVQLLQCSPGDKFNAATGIVCPVQTLQFSRFLTDLSVGIAHPDVKELQKFLNTHGNVLSGAGPGSVGNETSFFGALTKAALIRFQHANTINPPAGFFGPITRRVINQSLR